MQIHQRLETPGQTAGCQPAATPPNAARRATLAARVVLVLFAATCLFACKSAGETSQEEYEPLIDPSSERPEPADSAEEGAADERPETTRITLREDAIELDGRTIVRLVAGELPKYPMSGDDDLSIPPVARALEQALDSNPDNTALIIDTGPKVKYRVMMRVLHTAQSAGYEDFYIQRVDDAPP
jgi:hypothetical protein